MSLYGIKDAANLTLISKATGKQVLFADYANTSNIEFKSEQVYATYKGVKAIRWDKNREGTFKVEAEIFDLKWISILLGSDFITGVTEIAKREVLKVATGKVTISDTPKANSLAVFKLDTDMISHKAEQTLGTTSTADRYAIAGKDITLNTTSCPDGSYVVCYYLADSQASASKFEVKIDKFPGNYEIFGDTYIRTKDGVDKFIQLHLPNAKPQSNMTMNFDVNNPTKLEITFDLFPDANNNMAVYTIIE